jgi:hypothetical protein
MPERGEFTRKFDRDILGDASAEVEEQEAQRRAAASLDQALEAEFSKILDVLAYRAEWLRDRFKGCKDVASVDFRGRRFEFSHEEKQVGWIEFRVRLTDTQEGIRIESFMELDGQFPRRHDYVNFPKTNVPVDRVKRFVESKLLEFASPYQDAFGT